MVVMMIVDARAAREAVSAVTIQNANSLACSKLYFVS